MFEESEITVRYSGFKTGLLLEAKSFMTLLSLGGTLAYECIALMMSPPEYLGFSEM